MMSGKTDVVKASHREGERRRGRASSEAWKIVVVAQQLKGV